VLVGYASDGLHTNGYSLARRIVFDELHLDLDDELPGVGGTAADELLRVHRSYRAAIAPVLDRVSALAHITGGGIAGNLVRSLPDGCGAEVEVSAWPAPPLFTFLEEAGKVATDEMFEVFNMGIGMIAAAAAERVDSVRQAAQHAGVDTWVIGRVISGSGVSLV
jgi:phosphoribosylformylglycinamidine cyclo-ligase